MMCYVLVYLLQNYFNSLFEYAKMEKRSGA
jgi:hypothetical protein